MRIIGGRWRGRKIQFACDAALRPTQDRIRETLFNWLQPNIYGACCLDCFAGSGVLGFEALSRGASFVTFFECEKKHIQQLQFNANKLAAENIEIIQVNFPESVPILQHVPFDIVFLDPPFKKGLILYALGWLKACRYIKKGTVVYMESELDIALELPTKWHCYKEKKTKTLRYSLCEYQQ